MFSNTDSLPQQNLIGRHLCSYFGREAILHKAFYLWQISFHRKLAIISISTDYINLFLSILFFNNNYSKQEIIFNRRIHEGKNNSFFFPLEIFLVKEQELQQVKIPGQGQDNLYDS